MKHSETDQYVCGIHNKGIQKQLLELTLKKTIELSQAFEAEKVNAKAIQTPQPEPVQQVSKASSGTKPPKKPCHHCGKGFHKPSECYYKEFMCRKRAT